jgi:hypothetical protein
LASSKTIIDLQALHPCMFRFFDVVPTRSRF